ncbi:hypothetical protein L6164_027250 [Bauhinia variegata]|uniref:Uncharacterized protein n=1 Tax=Bauhinia variegata TaxID=167791 RepID=A0ACB9LSX3_BAUVA|nr:hypothetical protein L6164_027250 [Bauhinia variegata]
MRGLGNSVELLRPLVETKAWNYAVVWKYGDDPTRFIEWMGCCCMGAGRGDNERGKTKEEKGVEYSICRDSFYQHPVRTKACEAIAQLPYTMSLYSGVHGEVAVSNQPRWITQEATGTQVLIPIVGGLVELFTLKLIPKDIKIIEFITAHSYFSLKQEAMSPQSCTNLSLNEHPPSEECYLLSQRCPSASLTSSLISRVHLAAVTQNSSYHCIEGSSSGSNPSNEHTSSDMKIVFLTEHENLNQSVKQSSSFKRSKCNETSRRKQKVLGFNCGTLEEDNPKLIRETQGYHSKNLVTERNRRNRIKDGLFALRALVPKITKMDRASILGDAISYIQELQEQEKELRNEIRNLEEENCENPSNWRMTTDKAQGFTKSQAFTEFNQSSSGCIRKTAMEVQVNVHQIGRRDFLITLCCEQKRGGFARLMETIHSFGLQVTNANSTTFDGKVLNILTVEASKHDIQPKKLREYLIERTG